MENVWKATTVAGAADVATTVYGLGLGLQEANYLAVYMMEVFGVIPGLVLLKSLGLATVFVFSLFVPTDYRPYTVLGPCIIWLLAALMNLTLIVVVLV